MGGFFVYVKKTSIFVEVIKGVQIFSYLFKKQVKSCYLVRDGFFYSKHSSLFYSVTPIKPRKMKNNLINIRFNEICFVDLHRET